MKLSKQAYTAAFAVLLASCGGGEWDEPLSCANASRSLQALAQLNAARAVARSCGGVPYPAAAPLEWSGALEAAAAAHSTDMASNNYFSHTGSDGSSASARTTASGYGPYTGENIAAGYATMDDVMTTWLNSPGHCTNIMNAQYRHYAIACASNTNAEYRTYWTQSFGIPN